MRYFHEVPFNNNLNLETTRANRKRNRRVLDQRPHPEAFPKPTKTKILGFYTAVTAKTNTRFLR